MRTKTFLLFLLTLLITNKVSAQKEYISREVAKKNYQGYLQMQDSNYTEAIKFFDEAITKDPDAFFVYQNRAICRLELKDTLGAISDFKMNIKLEPANTETRYALGNIYKKQNDSLNAVYYFRQAIEKADMEYNQTKLLFMNNFVGHVYRQQQKWDSALVYYDQVKKYTPQDASVYINSAVCYYHLDSTELFCSDLERSFILGGAVNCFTLKGLCNGCSHLLAERGGNIDTTSMKLDSRLSTIISDTISYHFGNRALAGLSYPEKSRKVKIYYNHLWQICLPENASYYREAFWAQHVNYFGGSFTDYYRDGNLYAKGRIESTQLTDDYVSYYPNGSEKIKGRFAKGLPVGRWTWFKEDGQAAFQVAFLMDEFKIQWMDSSHPDYAVNSGTGKFTLMLDNWNGFSFELQGEYQNEERNGKWQYIQGGKVIISENFKKGAFKSGFATTDNGKVNLTNTALKALTFVPPQLTQVRNLFFDSIEAANHYSFIQKFGF
ncbi:hypothetical protein INQ51_00120 [Maribellus sp. CM-23]|uniref:hypothetical protein n=1 Tax=Maribellus sp. CM-23 TaxID=2781026 RepID=UPI001F381C9B|nr:hypothetical protein [Maribellus sp. CM-23]MCE4562697.1 hypothetical protein [Maribellus sp. CM-23]